MAAHEPPGEAKDLVAHLVMPAIGPRCHELRITAVQLKKGWRVMYYLGRHAIAVLGVFQKTTRATPAYVIDSSRRRLAEFRKVDES